jgi:hypothetical protein
MKSGFQVLIVVLWDVTLCSLKSLASHFLLLVSCLPYSSTGKMEVMFLQAYSLNYTALQPRRPCFLYVGYGEDKRYLLQVHAEYS